jgi:integrase/recombinase XerD
MFLKTRTQRHMLQLPIDPIARSQYREAVRLFLLDCKLRNLSTFTIQSYYNYLESLQHDLESWQLTLINIQPKDLSERMIQNMLRLDFATNTINGRIRTCQQFFKFLFQEGILEQNIALGLKPLPNVKTILQTFSELQLKAILSLLDRKTFKGQRDYAMLLILLDTGIRVNELAELRKSDLDLDEHYLIIHASKNRKARRMPFQQTSAAALKCYLDLLGTSTLDVLWQTVSQKPIARSSIIDLISQYCKKAGIIGVKGSSHTFRHTMAKLFLLNGGQVDTLQYLLGHSSLEMTRYYIDLFPVDLHQQHQKYSPIEHLFSTKGGELEWSR